MAALEEIFSITAQEIATKEPETVIVEKNRKLRLVGQIVGWSANLALLVIMSILPFAINNGRYGFTPDMAAGSYADREYIDTGDRRIYYFTFEVDWEAVAIGVICKVGKSSTSTFGDALWITTACRCM